MNVVVNDTTTKNRNRSKVSHDNQDVTDGATVITDATSNTEEYTTTANNNHNNMSKNLEKKNIHSTTTTILDRKVTHDDNKESNLLFTNDTTETKIEMSSNTTTTTTKEKIIDPMDTSNKSQLSAKKRFKIALNTIKVIKLLQEKKCSPPKTSGGLVVVDLEESSSIHSITPSLQSDTAGGDFLVDFPTSREEFMEHRTETVDFPTLIDNKRNTTTTNQKTQSVDEADARRPWRKYKPPPPPPKKVPIVESLMNEDTTTPSTLFDHPPETVNYLDTLDSDQLYKEDLDQYEHIGFAFEDEYDITASHFPMNQDVMTSDISVNNLNDDTSVLTDLRLAQTALGWTEDDVKSQRSTQIHKNIEPTKPDSDDDDPIQLPNTPIIVDIRYGVERRLAAIRARQKLSTTSLLQEEGKHTSVSNKPDESKRRRRRHRHRHPRKHLVTNSNDDEEDDDELQPYRHRSRSKSHDKERKDRHHRSRTQRQKSQRNERQDQPQNESENRHRSRSRRRKRIPIENEIQGEGERRYSHIHDRREEKNHLFPHDGDYSDEEALPTAVLGDDSDEEAEGRDTFDEEKGPLHIGKRASTGSLHDGLVEPDLQELTNDNLENFRNVFMQAEKKKGKEISFHGLWNSKLEIGSEHGSDLSQASQKSARFQQVKVTMRAKGFGLKMQRIFGPRLWAIKFYILVAFLLLVLLILAITIPLAIQKGKKSDLGTLSPSTTPTISPSKSIGYIEITSFFGENANDGAGSSLAIASDTDIIAIGLPNGASGVGEVRVFTLVDKQLFPYGKALKGKKKGDMFGNSLSISMDGQILAVGSPMANSNQGYVAVFEFNYERQDWVKMGQDITLSEEDTFVGSAISLSGNGNRLAIGIPRASGDNGQTLIFQYSSITGIWIRLGSTLYGSGRELHGFAVSLDGTGKTLAIGAVRSSTSTSNSGRVYLYRWDTTTWVPFGSTIFGRDLMGRSVSLSLDGMRVAIGSTGYDKGNIENVGACAVYGYLGDWVQLGSTLQGNTPEEKSGQSVVISADGLRVACGSAGGSIVRIYEEGESDWELVGNQPLVSESKQQPESNLFGAAIAMNSNASLLVIGAPRERVKDKENAGAVRVFEL